jgi:hypothetical protein
LAHFDEIVAKNLIVQEPVSFRASKFKCSPEKSQKQGGHKSAMSMSVPATTFDQLCEIGVLARCGASLWLSPSFIIPIKDGRVRWISDFHKLNKQILQKVYNLPKIQDILTRRSGYAYFTKLDISMQYYTFKLDEPSKEVCTICTPFGNCKYNRLPMYVQLWSHG